MATNEEDKGQDDIDSHVNKTIASGAPKQSQKRSQGFLPNVVKNRAGLMDRFEAALMGIAPAMEGARRGAESGDPLIAALTAIGGAAKAPNPQAIADARLQDEIKRKDLEFQNTPIGRMNPSLASDLSEAMGQDISDVPYGMLERFMPALEAKGAIDKARTQTLLNTPVNEETADFWSRITNLKKEQLVGKTPMELRAAAEIGKDFSKNPEAVLSLARLKADIVRKAKTASVPEIKLMLADEGMKKHLLNNPEEAALFDEALAGNIEIPRDVLASIRKSAFDFKKQDISLAAQLERTKQTISALESRQDRSQEHQSALQNERHVQDKLILELKNNYSLKRIEFSNKLEMRKLELPDSDRALFEQMLQAPLPENVRANTAISLLKASQLSSSASGDRQKANEGMQQTQYLLDELKDASPLEMLIASPDGKLADGLRMISNNFTSANVELIHKAAKRSSDLIAREMTGATLTKEEQRYYGDIILKILASKERNMDAILDLNLFFTRVYDDIGRGRRIPGGSFDPVFFNNGTGYTVPPASGEGKNSNPEPVKKESKKTRDAIDRLRAE